MKRIILLIALSMCSCAPRGETHSVDTILSDAKSSYSAVSASQQGAAVKPMLDQLNVELDGALSNSKDASRLSSNLNNSRDLLVKLVGKAGYTSRPAMGELISEFGSLGASASTANESQVKLLVARTYSLLASELETTKFSL